MDDASILGWLAEVSQIPLNASSGLHSCLQDGIVLCHVLNAIQPDTVRKCNEPADRPLAAMENITSYLKGCWKLGVPSATLFVTSELYHAKNLQKVRTNLIALANVAVSINPSLLPLAPKDTSPFSWQSDVEREAFSDAFEHQDSMASDLADLRQRLEDTELALSKANALCNQKDNAHKREMAKAGRQLQQAFAEVGKFKKELQLARTQLKEQMATMGGTENVHDIAQLKRDLAHEREVAARRIYNLEDRVRRLQEEHQEQKRRQRDVASTVPQSALRDQIEALQTEICQERKRTAEAHRNSQTHLSALRKANAQVQEWKEATEKARGEALDEREALIRLQEQHVSEVQALEDENLELVGEIEALQTQLDAVVSRGDKVKDVDWDQLRAEARQAVEHEFAALETKAATDTQRLQERWHTKEQTLRDHITELKTTVADLRDQLQQASQQQRDEQSQAGDFLGEVVALEKAKQAAQEEVAELRMQLRRNQVTSSEHHTAAQALSLARAEWEQERDRLARQLTALRAQSDARERELLQRVAEAEAQASGDPAQVSAALQSAKAVLELEVEELLAALERADEREAALAQEGRERDAELCRLEEECITLSTEVKQLTQLLKEERMRSRLQGERIQAQNRVFRKSVRLSQHGLSGVLDASGAAQDVAVAASPPGSGASRTRDSGIDDAKPSPIRGKHAAPMLGLVQLSDMTTPTLQRRQNPITDPSHADKRMTGFFCHQDIVDGVVVETLRANLKTLLSSKPVQFTDFADAKAIFKMDNGRRTFTFLLKEVVKRCSDGQRVDEAQIVLSSHSFEILLFLVNTLLHEMELSNCNDFITAKVMLRAAEVIVRKTDAGVGDPLRDHVCQHPLWSNVSFWEEYFWDTLSKAFKDRFGEDVDGSVPDEDAFVASQLKTMSQVMFSWNVPLALVRTLVDTVASGNNLSGAVVDGILDHLKVLTLQQKHNDAKGARTSGLGGGNVKQSHLKIRIGKKWQRALFTLASKRIQYTYFNKDTEKDESSFVELVVGVTVKPVSDLAPTALKSYSFTIREPGGSTLHLMASRQGETASWISAVNAALDHIEREERIDGTPSTTRRVATTTAVESPVLGRQRTGTLAEYKVTSKLDGFLQHWKDGQWQRAFFTLMYDHMKWTILDGRSSMETLGHIPLAVGDTISVGSEEAPVGMSGRAFKVRSAGNAWHHFMCATAVDATTWVNGVKAIVNNLARMQRLECPLPIGSIGDVPMGPSVVASTWGPSPTAFSIGSRRPSASTKQSHQGMGDKDAVAAGVNLLLRRLQVISSALQDSPAGKVVTTLSKEVTAIKAELDGARKLLPPHAQPTYRAPSTLPMDGKRERLHKACLATIGYARKFCESILAQVEAPTCRAETVSSWKAWVERLMDMFDT